MAFSEVMRFSSLMADYRHPLCTKYSELDDVCSSKPDCLVKGINKYSRIKKLTFYPTEEELESISSGLCFTASCIKVKDQSDTEFLNEHPEYEILVPHYIYKNSVTFGKRDALADGRITSVIFNTSIQDRINAYSVYAFRVELYV